MRPDWNRNISKIILDLYYSSNVLNLSILISTITNKSDAFSTGEGKRSRVSENYLYSCCVSVFVIEIVRMVHRIMPKEILVKFQVLAIQYYACSSSVTSKCSVNQEVTFS